MVMGRSAGSGACAAAANAPQQSGIESANDRIGLWQVRIVFPLSIDAFCNLCRGVGEWGLGVGRTRPFLRKL
jgi:hypothetical protein